MPKAVIVAFDDRHFGSITRQSSSLPLQQYRNGTPLPPFEVKEHVGRSESSPENVESRFPMSYVELVAYIRYKVPLWTKLSCYSKDCRLKVRLMLDSVE